MAFVVFAGQSNAVGMGMTCETLQPEVVAVDFLSFIWSNASHQWEVLYPGLNTGTPVHPEAWGPETAFAAQFRLTHPFEPLFIVKSAKGSTGLEADPCALDWSPCSTGEMFDLTTERIAEARAALGGLAPDAVFLFQGEQDATCAEAANAYAENLRGWLAAIRAEWMGDPQGDIAFGRINDSTPYFEQVRWAQCVVDGEDPNAVSFDTYDFAMQCDNLHYAADGFLEIGRAFCSAYEGWI